MKYVIFDIDGTLCHSKIDNKCFLEAFSKALNVEVVNRDWNSYKHVTDQFVTELIIREHLGEDASGEMIDSVVDYYVKGLDEHLTTDPASFTLIPGARKVYDTLNAGKEYKIGIATGGFLRSAELKLKHFGFDTRNVRIKSSEKHQSKLSMILELIKDEKNEGNTFDEIFYIGDRLYDYNTAMDAGIEFIGIDYDRNNRLKDAGVKNVFYDFEPTLEFLKLIG